MHKNLYSLEKDNIDKVLKRFIYDFVDLYPQISEDKLSTYEFTDEIKEKVRKEFNKKDTIYFMNWIIVNLDNADYATDEDRYQFIKKFFELIEDKFLYS